MTIPPNPLSSATVGIHLWSVGPYQFAVWYDLAGELRIGRIQRGTHQWGVNHTEWTVTGTPRTVLALPVALDEHNYPSVCVDGNGRIHVWANMHNNPMRYIRSVDPHTSDTWTAASGWTDAASELPSVEDRCTYPTPIMFPDNTMAFYLRNGSENPTGPDPVSGQYNSYMWDRTASGTSWGARRFVWQGLSVPDAGGPGIPGGDGTTAIDDRTNWSVYPSNFLVERGTDPYPGRLHVSWVWRSEGVDGFSNQWPSYAYSEDKGVTWKAIDGTPLTVPITPLNSIAARCTPGCPGAWVRSISRASNVVVADLDTANHGFIVGDTIHCRVIDTSYDGQFTVASIGNPTSTSIAWAQVAADDASGGTGSVTKTRYLNWGTLTIDYKGFPHILGSIEDAVYIRRNATNTAWVESIVANPIGGVVFTTRFGGVFWRRGDLWGLASSQPNHKRRVRAFRITNPGPVHILSGDVGPASGWDPSHDGEAWRLHGLIETLAPDGDRPRVFSFGGGGRFAAA